MTSNMEKLNSYIKRRNLELLDQWNKEFQAYCEETGDNTLYEDAYTTYTLADIHVKDGYLCYKYDGQEEKEAIVLFDEKINDYYEVDIDGIADFVEYWRACLERTKRIKSLNTIFQ